MNRPAAKRGCWRTRFPKAPSHQKEHHLAEIFEWIYRHPQWVFWAALPAQMLHQFEEYVFPGGFLPWFNREVFRSESDASPISPKIAFVINCVIGWPLYAAVGYVGLEQMWFVMPAMGILFVNAWFHIALSISSSRYSPGTFTSLGVLLPLSLYAFYYYIMTWEIGFRQLFIAVAVGLVFHVLMLTIPRELIHAKEKRLERQQ